MREKKTKQKNINDGACFTHTYILKIIFFLGNAENCMPKLLLKKNIISHFSASHAYIKPSLMVFSPFPLLHYVFLSISTNCPPEKRQSFIISFTFFHCAFSNASSNCLHEKTRSHIGCICLTFLHCAFSNVASNFHPKKMQSHIVCTCSNFLHCMF